MAKKNYGVQIELKAHARQLKTSAVLEVTASVAFGFIWEEFSICINTFQMESYVATLILYHMHSCEH